jgi:hypothetical protein
VVRNGLLVEPESAEALAVGILRLYRSPDLRDSLASAGCRDVENFDVDRVARVFLSEVAKVVPGIAGSVFDPNVATVTLGGHSC